MSEEIQMRVIAYLFKEMDAVESARFETELESDPDLRRNLEELRPVVGRLEDLPQDLWEDPPPLALVPSVSSLPVQGVDAPGTKVPLSAKIPGYFNWPRVGAGFATVCVIFAVGIFVGTRFDSSDPVRTQTGQTLALKALGEAPPQAAGQVRLASSSEDAVTLDVNGLRPTGEGEFYELWLLGKDGELVALGSFRVRADGDSEVKVPLPVDPSQFKYFDVSIQENNGDPQHSGRSVLRGLSQA